jgi:head-tail adaptor
MRRWNGIWIIAITIAATPAAAQAQAQARDAAGRVLGGFADCRRIEAATPRLACLEAAATALEQAVRANDIRIVDRADVQKARRSLFGLNLPNVPVLGTEDEKDTPATFVAIESNVRSARPGPNGRVEITIADESGAVWQTTEAMNFPPKPGAKVRIRKGTMGGYFMNVDGRSYRAMRLR